MIPVTGISIMYITDLGILFVLIPGCAVNDSTMFQSASKKSTERGKETPFIVNV